jgi:hypothetical protein
MHLQNIQSKELAREEKEIEERRKALDAKKKEEADGSKSVDTHRSKERAQKGALKQAEEAAGGKEKTTKTTEKRRQEDATESDEDKEQRGPRKTGKTVDITRDKGDNKNTSGNRDRVQKEGVDGV